MARFKPVHQGVKLLPVDFDRQLHAGTFEHALAHLIDHELDLSEFEARYCNDACGASAYSPAVLLKIILLAYSRGITSSRRIEAACRENVLFMALSGDSQPHFTTLAAFVSELGDMAAKIFAQVLTVCDRQGLIGREHFAIDGVKLPSNASKARSGTRAEFEHQLGKMEAAAQAMIGRHRSQDADPSDTAQAERERRKLKQLQQEAEQLRAWLQANPEDRKGPGGGVRKSNRTDNESAKMATGKGVIQGYTGVAAVDEKAQIVIDAQAHGTGSEQELLEPVVKATDRYRDADTVISADSGYHSEANLEALAKAGIEAYLPDKDYRKRDERYAGQDKHKAKPDPLHDKSGKPAKPKLFAPADFDYDPEQQSCRCPAGNSLYRSGRDIVQDRKKVSRFKGTVRDCVPCPLRDLRGNKKLDRFTLRGQGKVDGQWKLYCLVHNIEKLSVSAP